MLRPGWRVHPTLRFAAKGHGHFPLSAAKPNSFLSRNLLKKSSQSIATNLKT